LLPLDLRDIAGALGLAVDRADIEVDRSVGFDRLLHRVLEGVQHRGDAAIVRRLGDGRKVMPAVSRTAELAVDEVAAHVVRAATPAEEALREDLPVRARGGRRSLGAELV